MTDKPTVFIFQMSAELFEEWGFFEARGYLPPMPGTLEDDCCFNHRNERWEAHLTLTEEEADAFAEACRDLGHNFAACMRRDLRRDIVDFLYEVAL